MKKTVCILLAAVMLGGCSAENPEKSENYISPDSAEETVQPKQTPEPERIISAEDIADENYINIDNKGSGWGFKKNKGAEPDIFEETKELFRRYNTFYLDENRGKVLYLTFDEGYENGYTGQILDTLKKCGVPAAFFVTGPYLDTESELVGRMISEGHIVGNHTVHHPNLPKIVSAEKMAAELCALNEKFLTSYGLPMKYMRPPEGEYSERLLKVADTLGYKTVFWSFAYKDWDPKLQKGADYAFEQVTPYLHDGAVILLHAVSKDNADALERIINFAKEQGYEFKSLDELKLPDKKI
jgi:peptidoglycan-N-acetylmuramic acid deacetylase